jgi:hypothetical protein
MTGWCYSSPSYVTWQRSHSKWQSQDFNTQNLFPKPMSLQVA